MSNTEARDHEDVMRPLIHDREAALEAGIEARRAALYRLYARLMKTGNQHLAEGIYYQESINLTEPIMGQFVAIDRRSAPISEFYIHCQRQITKNQLAQLQ